MATQVCKLCGKLDDPETFVIGNISSIMRRDQVCFNCGFWIEKIEIANDMTFVINGNRYQVLPDAPGMLGFKGFGGRAFRIKRWSDGTIIETRNLWHQGTVPEYFKDQIPNNAEFVNT